MLYLLRRLDTDEVGYDEAEGFVVCADAKDTARAMAWAHRSPGSRSGGEL